MNRETQSRSVEQAHSTESISELARDLGNPLRQRLASHPSPPTSPDKDFTPVGDSSSMVGISRLIDLAAAVEASVLITGETGTGKNLVANAIHVKSHEEKRPFVSINCAALPQSLIEAELFGYEKGAFTHATYSRKGIFEMAVGGTLFLDEIGEMPFQMQSKLLGVLEDKMVRRVGGEITRPVDVRIIAATSTEIEQTLDKTFRSDLYYRLSVIRIHIPPLREHRQDIPQLCDHLLKQMTTDRSLRLDANELAKVSAYSWPGNVRELRNVLERSAILQKGPFIRPSELLQVTPTQGALPFTDPGSEPIRPLKEVEKQHILSTLEKLSYNYTRSSRALGISLSTLKRKIRSYRQD